MRDTTTEPLTFAELCCEAAERFGNDWAQIHAYVAAEIDKMPVEQRTRLCADVSATLDYAPPNPENGTHH
jgi:hypothetical protein